VISAHKVRLNPPDVPQADVLVMAVKPQVSEQVMPLVARYCGEGTVVLSVMAGKTVEGMARHFGATAPIVRTSPNTPASVGRGMTGAFANAAVTPARRSLVDTLLSSVGRVAWVDDESLIDVVTAVSGSGPAYVFYLAEAMTNAGIKAGLPAELAAAVARSTVEGAGELLYRSPDVMPSTLRQNVTSPNGTTYAALQVLMAEDAMPALFERAIAAATKRSRELAG
jgi:pyrroline-5-carboxylate reductase